MSTHNYSSVSYHFGMGKDMELDESEPSQNVDAEMKKWVEEL
jgi:hypothetical protein